jgi:hypothetical protein
MTDDLKANTEAQMGDAIFIHSMALYALSQMLEDRGILTGGDWASHLRRFKSNSNPDLENALENFCRQLEDNPFGPRGTMKLTVIDGGAND